MTEKLDGAQATLDAGVAHDKSENKKQSLKVELHLPYPLEIDGRKIEKITLREPCGNDLAGLSISDILAYNVVSVGLLVSRIVEGEIIDRYIIEEAHPSNLREIVEAISLFIDAEIEDIDRMVKRKGKMIDVTLPQLITVKNKKLDKLTFREVDNGDLRGIGMQSVMSRDMNAILKIAPRNIVGIEMSKDDFRALSISSLLLIGHGLALSLEGEGKKRPKLIRA